MLLDARQLSLLQSVLLQQVRLLLGSHQLVVRNELVLGDVDDELVLDEALHNHIRRRIGRQFLVLIPSSQLYLLRVAGKITAKHQNDALNVVGCRLLQLGLEFLSVDLVVSSTPEFNLLVHSTDEEHVYSVIVIIAIDAARLPVSPANRRYRDGDVIQHGLSLCIAVLSSQPLSAAHISHKRIQRHI